MLVLLVRSNQLPSAKGFIHWEPCLTTCLICDLDMWEMRQKSGRTGSSLHYHCRPMAFVQESPTVYFCNFCIFSSKTVSCCKNFMQQLMTSTLVSHTQSLCIWEALAFLFVPLMVNSKMNGAWKCSTKLFRRNDQQSQTKYICAGNGWFMDPNAAHRKEGIVTCGV